MQGHALFARHAGSTLPCPYVDYEAGFNGILAGAYRLEKGETIEKLFGKKWDPYVNDATYTISMLTLEELGATGNKVRLQNPVGARVLFELRQCTAAVCGSACTAI